MKILMLGWELPPYNSGGLGVACYQMCKYLAQQGTSIDFVVPYQDAHDAITFMDVTPAMPITSSKLRAIGGAYDSYCYECPQTICEHAGPTDIRGQQLYYNTFVEKYAPEAEPDIIHAHDWLTFEAGMRAKTITGKPLIVHVHATEFDRSGEHEGNPLVHEIEYNGLIMADRIIAVSQATKNIIVSQYNIPAEKIEVIYNSIDDADIDTTSVESTYVYLRQMKKQGYKIVVSLGRLTVQKGLTFLLQAAKKALDKDEKLLFLIAGEGEQRNELIMLVAELGIANKVIFTGFVRGARWRDAYAIGDMFIMPSVSEPFGLTALEAAGYGNAILLSKQAGVGELLKNVLRFDYWDTNKLANYMVAVAKNPALQQTLVDNVHHEFAALSWENAALACKKLYAGAKA